MLSRSLTALSGLQAVALIIVLGVLAGCEAAGCKSTVLQWEDTLFSVSLHHASTIRHTHASPDTLHERFRTLAMLLTHPLTDQSDAIDNAANLVCTRASFASGTPPLPIVFTALRWPQPHGGVESGPNDANAGWILVDQRLMRFSNGTCPVRHEPHSPPSHYTPCDALDAFVAFLDPLSNTHELLAIMWQPASPKESTLEHNCTLHTGDNTRQTLSLCADVTLPPVVCNEAARVAAHDRSIPIAHAARSVELFVVDSVENTEEADRTRAICARTPGIEGIAAADTDLQKRLCVPQREPNDDTVVMIDETEGVQMVGAVLGPLTDLILKPILDQMTTALTENLLDNVAKNVGRSVQPNTPEVISAHVSKALVQNLTNLMTDVLTDTLTKGLTKQMAGMLTPFLHQNIMDEVEPPLSEKLLPPLEKLVPDKLEVNLPEVLERSMAPIMTMKLTRSVTHALVPAVIMALRRENPKAWQYPECTDEICERDNDEISKYYIQWYSGYFGHYYSEYYSPFFEEALVKVDALINKGKTPDELKGWT